MTPQDRKAAPPERIAIIGLGKVGTAVGALLRRGGYTIAAVSDASPEAIRKGLPFTGGEAFGSPTEAAAQADCILITTGDDMIARVCESIAGEGGFKAGDRVIHMSGAGGLDLLETARQRGAWRASIHPIQSFADVEGAIASLPGSTFGITADPGMTDWCVRLVRDLGGTPFFVAEADKALYHAAACMASNYLTTLMHLVESTYGTIGLSREVAIRAFWPVVRGTLKNIEARGTVAALTGPIARGDLGTIEKHLRALGEKRPDLLQIYCLLGLMTVDVARERGLPEAEAEALRKQLKGGY